MKPTASPDVSAKDSNRRMLKPIIEKRRRERINSHLEELKNLVCGNTRSKLEKADILELTVNHIRKLIAAQRRSLPTTSNTTPTAIPQKPIMDPTRAGFMPCPQEMQRLMIKNANDNILAAQQRLHQQTLSVSSPTSSCSPLSPLLPRANFLFTHHLSLQPMFPAPVTCTAGAPEVEHETGVWRPW